MLTDKAKLGRRSQKQHTNGRAKPPITPGQARRLHPSCRTGGVTSLCDLTYTLRHTSSHTPVTLFLLQVLNAIDQPDTYDPPTGSGKGSGCRMGATRCLRHRHRLGRGMSGYMPPPAPMGRSLPPESSLEGRPFHDSEHWPGPVAYAVPLAQRYGGRSRGHAGVRYAALAGLAECEGDRGQLDLRCDSLTIARCRTEACGVPGPQGPQKGGMIWSAPIRTIVPRPAPAEP